MWPGARGRRVVPANQGLPSLHGGQWHPDADDAEQRSADRLGGSTDRAHSSPMMGSAPHGDQRARAARWLHGCIRTTSCPALRGAGHDRLRALDQRGRPDPRGSRRLATRQRRTPVRTGGRGGARPVVLIAGGGLAALETLLALRAVAADQLDISLLAPGWTFTDRSATIRQPFEAPCARTLRLADAATSIAAGTSPTNGSTPCWDTCGSIGPRSIATSR
jgi:hypothetical protein